MKYITIAILLFAAFCCTQCAPSTRPPCDTSDLDSAYYDALIGACWDFEGPLHECPGYAEIAHDYEEKATARCTAK